MPLPVQLSLQLFFFSPAHPRLQLRLHWVRLDSVNVGLDETRPRKVDLAVTLLMNRAQIRRHLGTALVYSTSRGARCIASAGKVGTRYGRQTARRQKGAGQRFFRRRWMRHGADFASGRRESDQGCVLVHGRGRPQLGRRARRSSQLEVGLLDEPADLAGLPFDGVLHRP